MERGLRFRIPEAGRTHQAEQWGEQGCTANGRWRQPDASEAHHPNPTPLGSRVFFATFRSVRRQVAALTMEVTGAARSTTATRMTISCRMVVYV